MNDAMEKLKRILSGHHGAWCTACGRNVPPLGEDYFTLCDFCGHLMSCKSGSLYDLSRSHKQEITKWPKGMIEQAKEIQENIVKHMIG